MKIAVIGAGGFIGARLVESLHLGGGPSVVAISRHPSRCGLAARFTVDLRAADAMDVDSLATVLQGCSIAIHTVRGEASQLKRLASTFCRASARAGGMRRLVYLSSAEVHGRNPPNGTDEQTRINLQALDERAAAQLAAERQFIADCRKMDVACYVLRPGIVYGPRSPLVAEIIAEIRQRSALLFRGGEGVMNSIYVDNLITAIRQCLKARNGSGQPYLVGDSETVTWRQFYQALATELDLPTGAIRSFENDDASMARPPGLAPLQESDWKPSFQSASRHLGYAPTATFSEAIHRTCAWWRYAQGDFFAAA